MVTESFKIKDPATLIGDWLSEDQFAKKSKYSNKSLKWSFKPEINDDHFNTLQIQCLLINHKL